MEKQKISVQVKADSISLTGDRVVTLTGIMPRIVLAEFNTHRALSRNSASSRAIPNKKMLERVMSDAFIPLKWMKDHSGMQGEEYFTSEEDIEYLTDMWLQARDLMIQSVKVLAGPEGFTDGIGLTKQITNRLLEPFMWHHVIFTATEWENFLALRAHSAAEIHIQEFAYQVLEALNNSTPKILKVGEWHIPFGDNIDDERLEDILHVINYTPKHIINGLDFLTHAKLEIATARCARVSYINYEGQDDYKADLDLYKRLSDMGHWSPFEHVCTPIEMGMHFGGNLRGWRQLRSFFPFENKKDDRLNKYFVEGNTDGTDGYYLTQGE